MPTIDPAPHWERLLPDYVLVDGRTTELALTLNPHRIRGPWQVVITRLRGLFGALAAPDVDGVDPLEAEDEHDLLRLLDHLHRVRLCIHGQEERVLALLAARGVGVERIATAMDTSPDAARRRLLRIQLASTRGFSAAGEVEDL